MFRFVFGVAIGLGVSWLMRSKYIEGLKADERMAEIQRKTDAVLTESRHILQETRQELQAAADASATSFLRKADRIITAVEHPEEVEHEHGKVSPGETGKRE